MGGKNEGDRKSGFIDLSAFESVRIQPRLQTGNVIKGDQINTAGTHAIELLGHGAERPSVVVHREGDRVDRIEFVCQCGRGTTVRLEYDEE